MTEVSKHWWFLLSLTLTVLDFIIIIRVLFLLPLSSLRHVSARARARASLFVDARWTCKSRMILNGEHLSRWEAGFPQRSSRVRLGTSAWTSRIHIDRLRDARSGSYWRNSSLVEITVSEWMSNSDVWCLSEYNDIDQDHMDHKDL